MLAAAVPRPIRDAVDSPDPVHPLRATPARTQRVDADSWGLAGRAAQPIQRLPVTARAGR